MFATALAVVWLAMSLETTSPEWRDPEYGHRVVRLQKLRCEKPSRPLVLVFGTSRTQNAIRPSAMGFVEEVGSPRVFNFGQSGATPLKVLLTFQRLLDEGVHPGALVVETLPVWLASNEPAEAQFRDTASQLSANDLQLLIPYCEDPKLLPERWLAARANPWSAQRRPLMSHWLPQWLPWQKRIAFQWLTMDADGFVPFLYREPPAAFRASATAQARQQFAAASAGFAPSPLAVRVLRDLVERCRIEGIPIAFFEPPVAAQFKEWFDKTVWNEGENKLRTLAKEIGVELFSSPGDFTDTDFADGHHMLRGAADRYSRWLADAHLRGWLSRRQVKDQ